MLYEFCAENLTNVPAAIEAGARRIELCDNLTVGGTTPGYGVIRAAVAYAHAHESAVMVMARPRGGDFAYSDVEVQTMCDDVRVACELGADGVVFGCARDGHLDREASERVFAAVREAEAARGAKVEVTFHMAFDVIDTAEQLEAIDWLAEHGATRILTHGGGASTSIDENLDRLRELMAHAEGKLRILPGAGISWKNRDHVAEALGADELHGTKIVRLEA